MASFYETPRHTVCLFYCSDPPFPAGAKIMSHTAAHTPRAQAEAERNSLAAWIPHGQVNVGPAERTFSVLGGGALALWGLSRRGIDGLLLAAAGGALIYRG